MPRSARTSSGPEEPARIGVELIENAARKGGSTSARRLASAGPDPSFFSLDPPIKFLIKFFQVSSMRLFLGADCGGCSGSCSVGGFRSCSYFPRFHFRGGLGLMAARTAAALAAEGAQGGLPDPRGLCSGTDGLVGDGGYTTRLQCAEVGDTMSMGGTPGGDDTTRAVILQLATTLAPTPQTFDTTTALAVAAEQAAVEEGSLLRTVHGDVLRVRGPIASFDVGLCGFATQVGRHAVRPGDGVPVAYPHLPLAGGLHCVPDYVHTLAGGFLVAPRAAEEAEGEELEEDAGWGPGAAVAAVSWSRHERELLDSLGPPPVIEVGLDGYSTPRYHAASAAYDAAYAAALCSDPPPGVSGATLYVEAQWASALAAACAEDLVAGMAESGGIPAVDWETAYAEADDWQERQEARIAREAEMDAFRSTGLAGGHAWEEEGGEEWEDEFWE